MTLERRTPLKAGKPLARRTPLKAKTGLDRSSTLARGGRLKPRSAKTEADAADHADIRAQVLDRDGRCVIGEAVAHAAEDGRILIRPSWRPCFGRATVHHLKKASQGGGYTLGNLVAACSFHNDLMEDEPNLGRQIGMVL